MLIAGMHGLQHKKLTTRTGAARKLFNDDVVQSNRRKEAHVGSPERIIADGRRSTRLSSKRVVAHSSSSERSRADGERSERTRTSANGGSHGVNSQLNGHSSDGVNSQLNGATDGVNSQLNSASHAVNSQLNAHSDGVNSQLNSGSHGVNSQPNGSKRVHANAPARGRAKMARTELKMAPRSGKVELVPRGDR